MSSHDRKYLPVAEKVRVEYVPNVGVSPHYAEEFASS